MEQADREARRRTQPRRGRQIRDRADIERRFHLHQAQTFARDLVLDRIQPVHVLRHRIVQAVFFTEQRTVLLDRDVDVFVDRHADDRAVLAGIEVRQIGATTHETQALRRYGGDQS